MALSELQDCPMAISGIKPIILIMKMNKRLISESRG